MSVNVRHKPPASATVISSESKVGPGTCFLGFPENAYELSCLRKWHCGQLSLASSLPLRSLI